MNDDPYDPDDDRPEIIEAIAKAVKERDRRIHGVGVAGGNGAGRVISRNNRTAPCDEQNVLVGGTLIRTHRRDDCWGYWCPIHNQSPHHMRGWDQVFDPDEAITMQRVCPCGNLHPDPDSPETDHGWHKVSGCCGCCDPRTHIKRKASA